MGEWCGKRIFDLSEKPATLPRSSHSPSPACPAGNEVFQVSRTTHRDPPPTTKPQVGLAKPAQQRLFDRVGYWAFFLTTKIRILLGKPARGPGGASSPSHCLKARRSRKRENTLIDRWQLAITNQLSPTSKRSIRSSSFSRARDLHIGETRVIAINPQASY